MPPADLRRRDLVTREELITRLRDRLTQHGAPRLQLLLIVGLAGAVAFLVSAGGLRLGLSSMTVRYPLAAACGYLTFILLIRVWIVWQRGRWDPSIDFDPGAAHADLPSDPAGDDVPLFQGGGSGGAGASEDWTAGSANGLASGGRGGTRMNVDFDLDELWPIALAAACAVGGLVAVLYVVYAAPILLAEVALDGAVVTALYRRMRRADAAHWAATTLRRTWMSAVALVVFTTIVGFAFERIAPDARSIGGVIRALVGDSLRL